MTASQVGRELGISLTLVSRWVQEAAEDKKQAFPAVAR